jgi:hypothetical protein
MGELRFPRTRSLPSMIAVAVAQRMEDKASLIPSGMGDPSSDSKPAAARSVGAAAIAFAGMERDEDVTESTSTSDDPFDVAVASLPAVDGDAVAGSNSQTIQSADVVCGRGKMAFNHGTYRYGRLLLNWFGKEPRLMSRCLSLFFQRATSAFVPRWHSLSIDTHEKPIYAASPPWYNPSSTACMNRAAGF